MTIDFADFYVEEINEGAFAPSATKQTIIDFTKYPRIVIGYKPKFFVFAEMSLERLCEISKRAKYVICAENAPKELCFERAVKLYPKIEIPSDLTQLQQEVYTAIFALTQQLYSVPVGYSSTKSNVYQHKPEPKAERPVYTNSEPKSYQKAVFSKEPDLSSDELAHLRRVFKGNKFIVFYGKYISDVVALMESLGNCNMFQTPAGVAVRLEHALTTDHLLNVSCRMQIYY